jgi:choline-glycine betaine transporter
MSSSKKIKIGVSKSGFYSGLNPIVTLISKMVIAMLVIYTVAFPDQAVKVLGQVNTLLLATFNSYYIYAVATFLVFCFACC